MTLKKYNNYLKKMIKYKQKISVLLRLNYLRCYSTLVDKLLIIRFE